MAKQEIKGSEDFSEMDDLINKTPKETELFVSHSLSIPEYVLIKLGDKPQNYIAQKLGVTDVQVSKWLSGASNMTLRTISKLEAALEIEIINPEISKMVKEHYGVSDKTINANMKIVEIKERVTAKVVSFIQYEVVEV